MKSTLSDNKQLFNVKAIAAAGLTPTAIPANTLGIVDSSTGLTVAPANFAALPAKFRLISKLNGEVYYSFDHIEKARMRNQLGKTYTAEQTNIWCTTIENCDCTKTVQLNINMDEESLMRRDGLTWTHIDSIVAVSPAEFACFCDCTGKSVYENNIMTKLLHDKVNENNSPFYEAEMKLDVSGLTTYATQGALDIAVPTPEQGDLAIITGTGTVQYDGTTWNTIATVLGVFTDVDTFIVTNKDVNTDDDTTNDKEKIMFCLKGKVQPAGIYRDLEVNYIYPRGVKFTPAIIINGGTTVPFTQTQALAYEIGAGYDMRAEEFDCLSLYTNLNHYPQLSDGIASPNLIYQFENNTNYSTVSFEFQSLKSGLEDVPEGEYKRAAVLLGAVAGSAQATAIAAIFIP